MKTLKVAHRKDHLSLIVDAAGGTGMRLYKDFAAVYLHDYPAGTTYQPRFMEVIKGEPPRHTVLKTKQTFAVIHGIGKPPKHMIYKIYSLILIL